MMEYHKINPLLAKSMNLLCTKTLFPTQEYYKDKLTESSYIFAPNHTNNFDGCLIWAALAKDYDIDTFMYREFWENFPKIAKILPEFNVYPITRDSVNIKELRVEINKLKNKNHSLIIFPQGRHADPEVMSKLFDYHLQTIPLGAFYLSARTSKPLVPVYIEPQQIFSSNTIIYGTPLNPKDFQVLSPNGCIQKKNLLLFARKWLEEVVELYKAAPLLTGRKMRSYSIHPTYSDATGLHHNTLKDPNMIANYFEQITILENLSNKTGITNIFELEKYSNISKSDIEQINEIKETYEKCLVRK